MVDFIACRPSQTWVLGNYQASGDFFMLPCCHFDGKRQLQSWMLFHGRQRSSYFQWQYVYLSNLEVSFKLKWYSNPHLTKLGFPVVSSSIIVHYIICYSSKLRSHYHLSFLQQHNAKKIQHQI